jgi:hypothetical protein
MNERIKVVDSPVGTGKTSWAINHINELPPDTKILVITPFLKEVDRFISSCPERKFVQPDTRHGHGRKIAHLLKLILEEKNIVSTHSLFSNLDDKLIDALRASNYILILDEVFNVIEKFDMWEELTWTSSQEKDELTRTNINTLVSNKFIEIKDDFKVVWIEKEHEITKYNVLKHLADRELVYLINGELLLWTFPIEVFLPGVFDEIYILTYQFDYQVQSYYYKYFDVKYDRYHIEQIDGQYELIPTTNNNYEKDWIEKINPLLNIIDNEKLNKIGNIYKDNRFVRMKTALSKSWYMTNEEKIKKISNNMINFFDHYTDAKGPERMWTCFQNDIKRFKQSHLPNKNWLALNCRATNEYSNKTALAYPINRYINPFYVHFFLKKDVKLDQDGFALSELVQWIWRSAIRNMQPVQLYVPSERMRTLLIKYLNNESIEF